MSQACKRVLHIVHEMDRGGTESLLMSVYRALDRRVLQFDFVVSVNRECAYDREIETLGGRIWHLPDPRCNFAKYFVDLRRILQSDRYAAAHCHTHAFSGPCLVLMKLMGVPVRVCHSHNTSDGRPLTPLRRVYHRLMRQWILQSATDLMCTATTSGEALFGAGCWQDGRAKVVRNGIDITRYESLPEQGDARRNLGLPERGVLIGHVGRLHAQKNHRFLFEILDAITRLGANARLVLVGTGDLRGKLERHLDVQGLTKRVSFLGSRSDVPQVLAALDLFLFPSLHEGLGIAVIEAQAAGLPVVASDAVPPEADLDIGLLHRLPLKLGSEAWARSAIGALDTPKPSWPDRKEALVNHGYDVRELASYLRQVYCSETYESAAGHGSRMVPST